MNNQYKKALLIPIDDRPITYLFPQLIGQVAGINTLVPPRDLVASFQKSGQTDTLTEWLTNKIAQWQPEIVIVCLDTLIYGGLVASRRSDDTLDTVLDRIENIESWKQDLGQSLKVFAQSSIMRISNNSDNTQEKPYWSKYGREIFRWSELLHQQKKGLLKDSRELQEIESKIDSDVLGDYIATRERNFQINLKLIEYAKSPAIDFLIFSQDDTGKFGINVFEKEELLRCCQQQHLTNVTAYAGTDEVLMTLLSRWLVSNSSTKPRISVHFNLDQGRAVISKFEGQTIEESLNAQIEAALLTVDESQTADFAVIVHTTGDIQGDHIWLEGHPELQNIDTTQAVKKTLELLEQSATPCVICDVAYANGSDPLLVQELMQRKDLMPKLWGYGGWNTTGNTIGSVLALGVARWHAVQQDMDTSEIFKFALFTRFVDDWAYQTQVRPQLVGEASQDRLNSLMTPLVQQISALLEFKSENVLLKFPWHRTFEVEIENR